jgi:hypothetical protein
LEQQHLKPADIKKNQKEATQTFLAMLEEKKKKAKMIPIQITSKLDGQEVEESECSASKKKPEFVSTFKVIDEVGKTDSEEKDKKVTAKELLERVKRKKEKDTGGDGKSRDKDESKSRDKRESKSKDKDDSKSRVKDDSKTKDRTDRKSTDIEESKSRVKQELKHPNADESKKVANSKSKVMVGKIAKSKKNLPRPSRSNKKQSADLNSDYSWYEQYYVNTYSLDPYSAAYSAYYAMVTGGDYDQEELSLWMQQQGYSEAMFFNGQEKEKPTVSTSDASESTEIAKPLEEPQAISVIVPNVHDDVNAMFYQNQMLPSVETDEMDVDSGNDSPPPPPGPPEMPQMFTTTLDNGTTLPNGIILPPGTKQTVVFPYPSNHIYAQKISDTNKEAVSSTRESAVLNSMQTLLY